MKQNDLSASLVILGGGKGIRIGTEKLFLPLGDSLLIEKVIDRTSSWFEETIIAVGKSHVPFMEAFLQGKSCVKPVRIIADEVGDRGPIEGLRCALKVLKTQWAFVIGCDMPFVRKEIAQALWHFCNEKTDVVCGRLNGFLEPLHAFYSVSCLPAIEKALKRGDLSLKSFYEDVRVFVVEENILSSLLGYRRSFVGINTKEELFQLGDV